MIKKKFSHYHHKLKKPENFFDIRLKFVTGNVKNQFIISSFRDGKRIIYS